MSFLLHGSVRNLLDKYHLRAFHLITISSVVQVDRCPASQSSAQDRELALSTPSQRDRLVGRKGELSSVRDHSQQKFCHNRRWVFGSLRVSWPFPSIPEHQMSFPFPASPLSGASRTRKMKPAVYCQKHINRLLPAAASLFASQCYEWERRG